MFTLLLLLLLVWVVLVVFVTGWSMWIQNYIYTEPAEGLVWRGPAAGSAIMLIVLLWVVLAYNAPGRWRPLTESTSSEDAPPFPELRVPGPEGEEVYKLMPGGKLEYRLNGSLAGRNMPSRPPKIIVIEGNERAVFEPERDEKGKLKQRARASSWFGSRQKEALRYIDAKGRVMEDGALGRLSHFRGGTFFGNLVLTVVFLAVTFVGFWLLVRFGLGYALGHALGLGAVMLLIVMPMLLERAERVAKDRAEAKRTAE